MQKQEEKEIMKIETVTTKVICDYCMKHIENEHEFYEISFEDRGYYKKDACSDECLNKAFSNFIKCTDPNKRIEIRRKIFRKK